MHSQLLHQKAPCTHKFYIKRLDVSKAQQRQAGRAIVITPLGLQRGIAFLELLALSATCHRLSPCPMQAVGVTLLQQASRGRRPGKKTPLEAELEAMTLEAQAMPKGQVGMGGAKSGEEEGGC